MSILDKQTGKWLNKSIGAVTREGKKDILLNMHKSIVTYRKLHNPNSVEFYRQKALREEAERLKAEKEEKRRQKEAERQAAIDKAKGVYDEEFDHEKFLREEYEKCLRELEAARRSEARVRALAASLVGGTYMGDGSDEDAPEMEDEGFNHEEKIQAAVRVVEIAQAKADKAYNDLLDAQKRTKAAEEAVIKAENHKLDDEEEGELDENGQQKSKQVVYYLRHIPQRKPYPYTLDQLIADEEKAEEEARAKEEARLRALQEATWSDRKREKEAEKRRQRENKEREREERRREKEEKKLLKYPPKYTPSEFNPVHVNVENVDFNYIRLVEDALTRLETDEEGPLIQKHPKKSQENYESNVAKQKETSPGRSNHSAHSQSPDRSAGAADSRYCVASQQPFDHVQTHEEGEIEENHVEESQDME